jgi:hypothetical protein
MYLDVNQLHHPFRSAYRSKHSVETALLRVHSDVVTAVDQQSHVVLVMLDLTAAFYTVDHQILLQRLRERFGMGEEVLSWIRSCISNRVQTVKIGKSMSPSVALQCTRISARSDLVQ